jgi:hypothetical protein
MSSAEKEKRTKLGMILSVVFLFAMFMGPGPGVLLINPDPTDPDAVFTFMGLPKVYAWGVLWYSVQLVIVGLLYTKVWVADDPVAASAKTPGESSPATENQD